MRPERIVGGATVAALLFAPLATVAAHAEWSDGFCRAGEGQSVVVDWRLLPGATGGTDLVRCIHLDPSGPEYPSPAGHPLGAPLDSIGVAWSGSSVIDTVNGIAAPEGWFWAFSTGSVGEDGGGQWLGSSAWFPEPGIDTFAGVTLMERRGGVEVEVPAAPPQFADDPEPTPEPDPSPEPTPEPDPSPQPTPEPDPSPEPTSEPDPTSEPEPEAQPDPEPQPEEGTQPDSPPAQPTTPAVAPTGGPTPPPTPPASRASERPTTMPPQGSPEPTPDRSPRATPTVGTTTPDSAPPTPHPEPAVGQATGVPSSPEPVWGLEATERSSRTLPAGSDDALSPLGAMALGVITVGGLGAAVTLSARQVAAPPVEDE